MHKGLKRTLILIYNTNIHACIFTENTFSLNNKHSTKNFSTNCK